jgi:hypothetical protein
MKSKTGIRLRKGMEDWRMERNCDRAACRKPFIPKREIQVHCSPACRRLAWNEKRRRSDLTKNPFELIPRNENETMVRYLRRIEKEAGLSMREAAREKDYLGAAYWQRVVTIAEDSQRCFGSGAIPLPG